MPAPLAAQLEFAREARLTPGFVFLGSKVTEALLTTRPSKNATCPGRWAR
jgi:hypothetical protein